MSLKLFCTLTRLHLYANSTTCCIGAQGTHCRSRAVHAVRVVHVVHAVHVVRVVHAVHVVLHAALVVPVHVVGAGPRVVSQPDAEVLDLERLPLLDLLDRDDLAGRLLELPQLPEEIPEP